MIGHQPVSNANTEEDLLFGNFCLFCGNDSLPEQAYCSSICELQVCSSLERLKQSKLITSTIKDLQSSSDQKYIVPALTSGSTSTGSGSSICSTPPSSPEKSPAQALGTVDESTADISSFNLPPSLLKAKPLPSKNLHFNYGSAVGPIASYTRLELKFAYQTTPADLSVDDISPPSPVMLGKTYGKKLTKSNSNQGSSWDGGSPTTPTETLLRLQRNQSQLPSAPRRESRGLMSPQLKATQPSDLNFAKKTAVRIAHSNLSTGARACGKPGCDSLHHPKPVPPKFDTRRPSAPAVRNFKVEFSDEDDADGESSIVILRGRKNRRVRDGSEVPRYGKRSESAHALGGVCDRFKPDIGSHASGLDMTPLDLGESAVRSSDDSDDEHKCSRGRSYKQDASVGERGRSKRREGPTAERRSRSRHREFSR